MDRNSIPPNQQKNNRKVVPHAGDVDRNVSVVLSMINMWVVPHAGDVDRNGRKRLGRTYARPSSPTRGTWIEIQTLISCRAPVSVVPHAGDVDRNAVRQTGSPSMYRVVPHAGDVDRNCDPHAHAIDVCLVVPHAGDVDRNVCRFIPNR